jgi:phosphatidylglycerol:prolipoprotein diacylglycerol transferase
MFAMVFAARRYGVDYVRLMDFLAPLTPLGFAAGRLGNFINAELPGRVTDLPWAMVFPGTDGAPRHPSQLYQFALEGVALFVFLWWFSSKPRARRCPRCSRLATGCCVSLPSSPASLMPSSATWRLA